MSCLYLPRRVPLVITGEQIKAARQRAGLTQGELAQRVGVSLRTVGNWERGESNPRSHETVLRDALRDHLEGAEPAPLQGISDVELLAEIARRFARTEQRAGERDDNAPPMKRGLENRAKARALKRANQDDSGEVWDQAQELMESLEATGARSVRMAARPGTPDHAPDEMTGEESQDPESNE